MKRVHVLILGAVLLVAAVVGRAAWRAHLNLVTLEVHNMPVRDVVRKLRWQTWEKIVVHKDLNARITLNVVDQPLNGVLGLVADQCEGRWNIAYPLYTTRERLKSVEKLAAGEVESPLEGWTNWNQRPNFGGLAQMAARLASGDTSVQTNLVAAAGAAGFGGPGGPGGFGNDGPVLPTPVTLEFSSQPPLDAAAALRQFGRVKVVPEDGTTRTVTLSLKEVPMDAAVAAIAKWEGRKWAKFYALEPRRGFRPTAQDREQMAQMPRPDPEQMRQLRQAFQPTEEMQARATQRVLDNIKNTTAEQRAQRARDRAQRGGRGGPGGFGGPGR
jgi:hypothetical protein